MRKVSRQRKKPDERQQTSSESIVALYDRESGLTTIRVPWTDASGRRYLREIKVSGNNVLDLGREMA